MKVAAIIQARMGSTRLPGKILKEILGKTLLEYQLERVERAQAIDDIIIATTTNKNDDPIVMLCEKLKVKYFRGSEQDVLLRYYEAATKFHTDVIVRLTSDCPIIDPDVIDRVIREYLNNQEKVDYVSNTIERTFPRGLDTEVIPYHILEVAHKKANLPAYREHVTAYIYHNPQDYKLLNVLNEQDLSQHRWTVDTIEDFDLIDKIITNLYSNNPHFTFKDVVDLLNKNDHWFYINHYIEQKKVELNN